MIIQSLELKRIIFSTVESDETTIFFQLDLREYKKL